MGILVRRETERVNGSGPLASSGTVEDLAKSLTGPTPPASSGTVEALPEPAAQTPFQGPTVQTRKPGLEPRDGPPLPPVYVYNLRGYSTRLDGQQRKG